MLSANSFMFPHQCAILGEFKLLDLWSFVGVKLPNDGTLMPKHVGGLHLPWSVFYDLCFIVFYFADFIG
jgi:hypothetical protein